MATTDIYRIYPIWTNTLTSEELSTHFDVHPLTDLSPAPTMAEVAGHVRDWWGTTYGGGVTSAMKAFYANNYALANVKLRRIKPAELVIQEDATSLPIAGTSGGDPYDPRTAVVCSLRTDQVGRSRRGRVYLPPPVEAAWTNGVLDESTATNFGASLDHFKDALMGDDLVWCVFSATLNSARDIDLVKVDRLARTQRRRQANTSLYVSTVV